MPCTASPNGPLNPDGSIADPLGKVGAEVSEAQGYEAARLTALAMLTSLKRELGDLDRVSAWLRVFGMVNSAPGFSRQPNIVYGFSDLILEVYGPEAGDHPGLRRGWRSCRSGCPWRSKPRSRYAANCVTENLCSWAPRAP
jgi:hypothetical protein